MSESRAPHDLPDALAANREDLRRRSRAERIHPLWLWIGILAGPLSFLMVRVAGIVLLSHGCGQTATRSVLGLSSPQLITTGITILGVLITLAAGLLSWRIWRRTSLAEDEVSAGNMPRVPFWALGGMLLNAFFLLFILVTGGTALVLSAGCP